MSSKIADTSPPTRASDDGDEAIPCKKGLKFWLIFTSMCTCLFLSALEVSCVSTALPTIANALNATEFTWVGTGYALAATAFIPMSGGLAQAFGRRPVTLLTIFFFAVGSAICGSANSMNMLIAGRIVQGLGGGGIQSVTGIILSDLVSLQERGSYAGFYGLTWALAAAIGPVVGGSLSSGGQWRWIFYLNLPICLISGVLVLLFLDLPVPPGTYRSKLMRMDWIGNFLVIASTVACTIGLTWGGIDSPWTSVKVLVPLVTGFVGFVAFIAYDAIFAAYPLVPFSILTNRTSLSGYIQSFCTVVVNLAGVYYYPVYFQACKGASPVKSGIYSLAFATLAPAAVIAGVSVKVTGRYREQLWTGHILTIVGRVLITMISATDSVDKSMGYLAIIGLGSGMLNAVPMYPIQAPLSVTQNAPAIAFMWFLRSFASVWGITIGSTVLQNELGKKLPASFVQSVPQGTAIVYALIPTLPQLPPDTLFEVQVAFANSLAVLWRVLAGISAAGFFASLFMKGYPLNSALDADWTLKDEIDKKGDQSTSKDEIHENGHRRSMYKGEIDEKGDQSMSKDEIDGKGGPSTSKDEIDEKGGQSTSEDEIDEKGGPSTSKEDQSTLKEDPSTSKEDQSTPEEDQSTPKEDQSTPNEDQSAPEEDRSTPKEDQPSPEEDQSMPKEVE